MKVPIRTCVVCREKFEKSSLLRINYKDNTLTLDPKGNIPGRGCYVCKKNECMTKLSPRNLNRAFKTNIVNFNNILNILRNDDMDF